MARDSVRTGMSPKKQDSEPEVASDAKVPKTFNVGKS